jgi:hypothetical protein
MSRNRLQQNPQTIEQLREIEAESGNQLVSEFTREVTESKQALRYDNAFLDGWLYYFGYTKSFQTPSGERAYKQICRETGRIIN